MSRARLPSLATVVLVLALPAPAQGGRVVGWGEGGAPSPFHFVSVAAGSWHSLAVTDDGTVVAWGQDDEGQATVPAGLTGVTAVAAGHQHSLALKGDGTVVAWGRDLYGEATVPAGLSGVVAVAAGASTSLALKDDGTVVAWGFGGVPEGLSGVVAVAAGVALKGDGTVVSWVGGTVPDGLSGVVAVAAGPDVAMALKSDGTVVVWGSDPYGDFTPPSGLSGVTAVAGGPHHLAAVKSDGTVVAWGYPPVLPPPLGLSGVVAVAAGYQHSLALKGDGTVVAWGDDYYGQATLPDRLGAVVAVAAGWAHSLGIRGDGTVVTWGSDSNGQGTVPPELVGATATTVAAGGDHSLALTDGGRVLAWGRNDFGQTTVPPELAGTTVTALAAGGNHSLALKHDGTVVAWGRNLEGQLNVPAGLSGVMAVAAGGNHSLALTDAGRVFAWGNDNYQQSAVPEAALTGVVAVAAGYQHSLALKGDGTVVAWGRNDDYGQATVPIGLSGVVAVAAGFQHSLALKGDGTVVAWGRNLEGQRNVPAGLSGVMAVAAGQYHSLALLAPTVSLTVVELTGGGAGRVSSSPGAVSCGAICSDVFDPATRVTLTATPEPGSLFAGWSGACYGTGPCVVVVYHRDVDVSARFELLAASRTLTVQTNGAGSGTVVTDPQYDTHPSISCSGNAGVCSGSAAPGATVVLTARPAERSVFAGWSGDIDEIACGAGPTCAVGMDRNRTITATFHVVAPTHHLLTVVTAGTGQGTVATAETDPAISCSGNAGTCSGSAAREATVTLTATPAAGSLFAGWSGWCTGAGPCVLIMGGDRSVTARFVSVAPPQLLTVATAGTGQGTVATADTDPAISCSGNAGSCSGSAAQGATVTLTATAAGGSVFAGWSGACSGAGACIVTMDADRAVTARFDVEGGGGGGGGGGGSGCATGGSGGALALLVAGLALCRPGGRRRMPTRPRRAPPFLPCLALLAFLLPGCDGGGGDDGGDTCPAPTLARCQDPTWLETDRCGIAERQAMAADENAPCSQILLAEAERQTQDRPEEEVALPQELGGGTDVAKVATDRDARLSDVYMPGTYTGSANAAAATATESGLSAAQQAKRTLWATNGVRIESCEEYVYEKYYEYSLFEDALAGERENAAALVDAVFGPASDVRSIGTRGIDGARLRTREGLDLSVQAPHQKYLVDLSRDSECHQAGSMVYLANPFLAMPEEFLSPAEWEQYGLAALRCSEHDVEWFSWMPPEPHTRWRWHRDARAALLEAGHSLAEADAFYPTIRQFTRLLGTYKGHQRGPTAQCCSTDPGGECCAQHEATTTSLGTQLRELFDRAVAAGCMEPGTTICSWSPAFFSDALRGAFENVHRSPSEHVRRMMATFATAMEDDFLRCVARTGDDFVAAAAWTFELPDGTTYPSASACAGRSDWPTCPVTDGAASPTAVDTLLQRFFEWEAAVSGYWQDQRAAMPPELFDESGRLRSQLGGGHADRHEAGNKLFGVYFEYEAGWSLPGVTASETPDYAALCFASPEAHAGFAVGGRAFGSATVEIASASTSFRLDEVDGDFTVLGARFWNPIGVAGELLVNARFEMEPGWIVPQGHSAKYPFTVAGWPMSMEAGIAGIFAVTPIYERTRASAYVPGQACWSMRAGFTPSIDLDALAALNLLDVKVARAGLRVILSFVGVSVPIAWEVSQRSELKESVLESVLLSVDVTDELVVQILAGRIAAFIELGIDPFSWTVSKDLFSWPGIPVRTIVQPRVHIADLSMGDLAILLSMEP